MKAIIQRVSEASVIVNHQKISEISIGLLVLLGIAPNDTNEAIEWLTNKIINMRIFSDENGKMNQSLNDCNGELLIVSQFTLFASTKKGNRPSFVNSAPPQKALEMYESFILKSKELTTNNVKTGIFGADMKVSLVNDGPITIILDTNKKE